MKFAEAVHSCKCGGHIRDESGTMQPGWKIMFSPGQRPGGTVPRNPDKRIGDFFVINPITGSNHMIQFTEAMKASDKWTTVP